MKTKIVLTLLLCVASALQASAQNTIESIRKEYQSVQEWIAMMSDDFPSDGIPPEYFDLHVTQNLPATGGHDEQIRMYYGYLESEEEGDPYPPHFLRFATARYNFAARQFYEEYLYDDKGQVMFIYAITPEIDNEMTPYELRFWFDGKRLLRFMAKKAELPENYDGSLKGIKYNEVYTGTTIPEKYQDEADRCKVRARRFLEMFKGIDDNTYL